MSTTNIWEQHIIELLKKIDPDNFETIRNITTVTDLYFTPEIYRSVKEQILSGNYTHFGEKTERKSDFREYLIIISFESRHQNKYLATIYDSDELWQDPEILETFQIE